MEDFRSPPPGLRGSQSSDGEGWEPDPSWSEEELGLAVDMDCWSTDDYSETAGPPGRHTGGHAHLLEGDHERGRHGRVEDDGGREEPPDSPLRRADFRDQNMSYKDFEGHSRAGRRAPGSRPAEQPQPAARKFDSCEQTSTVMGAKTQDQEEICRLAGLLDVCPADAIKLYDRAEKVACSRKSEKRKLRALVKFGFSGRLATTLISLAAARQQLPGCHLLSGRWPTPDSPAWALTHARGSAC